MPKIDFTKKLEFEEKVDLGKSGIPALGGICAAALNSHKGKNLAVDALVCELRAKISAASKPMDITAEQASMIKAAIFESSYTAVVRGAVYPIMDNGNC